MCDVQQITVEAARDFTAKHWPIHNRAQGIPEWIQSNFALVAVQGGDHVGAAIYKVVGGMAFLEQLVVAARRTHQGIGSRLLEAFEAHVRELGCHVIQLETGETQAPAFYEKHGYERVGTWPNGRFHFDWHLYRKALA